MWHALAGLNGPAGRSVALLLRCCRPGWSHDGSLEDLLAADGPVVVGQIRSPGPVDRDDDPPVPPPLPPLAEGADWLMIPTAPGTAAAPEASASPGPSATGAPGPAPTADWTAWWEQHDPAARPATSSATRSGRRRIDPAVVIIVVGAAILLVVGLVAAAGG